MQDEETLKRVLNSVLEERYRIDVVKHTDHHQFIADLIDSRRRRIERWDDIRANVWGWGIATSLCGFGGVIWYAAVNFFKFRTG